MSNFSSIATDAQSNRNGNCNFLFPFFCDKKCCEQIFSQKIPLNLSHENPTPDKKVGRGKFFLTNLFLRKSVNFARYYPSNFGRFRAFGIEVVEENCNSMSKLFSQVCVCSWLFIFFPGHFFVILFPPPSKEHVFVVLKSKGYLCFVGQMQKKTHKICWGLKRHFGSHT